MIFTSSINVTVLLMEIIKNYFLNLQLYGIVVLYDYTIEGSLNNNYLHGLEDVLTELSLDYQIPLQWVRIDWTTEIDRDESTNEDLLHQHIETGCEAFITITKDLNTFLTMKYKIQQYSTQRIRDRRFLFLSDHIMDVDFFHHPAFDIYPHHLLVAPSGKSNELELLTQKFVGTENRKDRLLLDTFHLTNCTFVENANLYPDKLDNLEGRVLTVSAISYIPYAYVERKETDDWGSVETENGTGSGQFGAVYLHQADIAVASIGQWYFNVFDSSSAIARSACTLLVPSPRPLSYALTPILPFDKGTWTLLFLSLIVCAIAFYLVKVYSELSLQKNERKDLKTSFSKTILEIIASFLQQGINVGSNKIAVRIFYGMMLFSAITLENAYSGELKSNLTYPKLVGRIDTIHDYVETNYFWGAPHLAWAAPVRMSQVRDSMLMYKRVQIRSIEYLHNMTFSGTYGVAVERLHSGRITFQDYITIDALDHLSILKDDLFYEYTMAITIRGWPYMERFNKLALETLQYGLFVHWETEITDTYLDLAIETKLRQLVAGHVEPEVPKVLQIAHVTGPLVILAIGYICALICYFGEHLWFYYKERRQQST